VREIDYRVTMKCQLCLTYGNLYTKGVCPDLVMPGVVGMLVWSNRSYQHTSDFPSWKSRGLFCMMCSSGFRVCLFCVSWPKHGRDRDPSLPILTRLILNTYTITITYLAIRVKPYV